MKYIDESHSYVSESGDSYVSVTQLIKMFEVPKDWTEIARKYAEKHKKTLEEVQAAWKEEGRKSIEKGVAYHNKMEADVVAEKEREIEGIKYPVYYNPTIDGIKLALPLKLEEGLYPELIVYSHRYKLAGQADLVEVRNGKINILDYKTSKEIKKKSYKNWKTGYEMFTYPLSHLMNCNFNHYSLQLNLYMLLIKFHNPKLKVGRMDINHIKDNVEEIYKVPNLQRECKVLLDYYADKSFRLK